MQDHDADASAGTIEGMRSTKVLLSTLWVFAVFNYLYADVITLMDPQMLKMIMTGQVGAMRMTEGLLLGAALLVETAIAMVLLSRVLEYRLNRWANVIVGAIHTIAVTLSVFVGGGRPTVYYMFFATIEVACTVFIMWCAWRWQPAPAVAAGAGVVG